MTKKIGMLTMALIICCCMLAGCQNNKYNAVILTEGYIFSEDFLIENSTYAAYYENEDYDEDDSSSDRYLQDKTSPEFRTFIIKNQDELDGIFTEFPQTDFDKKMVLIYMYTSIYSRPYYINSVKLEDSILKINFSIQKAKSGYDDAHMPGCIKIVFEMDTLDFDEVDFTLH